MCRNVEQLRLTYEDPCVEGGFDVPVDAVVKAHHAVGVRHGDVLEEVSDHLDLLVGQVQLEHR